MEEIMRSMTGHGHGEATGAGGIRVTVECASINRKQSEIQVNLPREYSAWEAVVREKVLAKVIRGRVQISIDVERVSSLPDIRLQKDVAREAFEQIKELQNELQLAGEIHISDLLNVPGIWKAINVRTHEGEAWSIAHSALLPALEGMLRMREREGKHLFEDLKKRSKILKRLLGRIRRLLPASRKHYRAQLMTRLEAVGIATTDERRLSEEVAWFCEKSDISEELTRLDSHFDQFEEYLNAKGAVGRTLEFLTQEIFRELNTLSAKANNASISQLVVDCKAELDKMREQISNVE
jgi:uncharacterized protein (TIGR00255 family)